MWTCPNCNRIFKCKNQPHSCKKVDIEDHFPNKAKAKELFTYLVEQINAKIGGCKIISIPCCIHLFGKHDFLAVLPKKAGIEVRFALDKTVDDPRFIQAVQVSKTSYKNCFKIESKEEIDDKLLGWIEEAYHLQD